MFISVVICTYNNCKSLKNTLLSLLNLKINENIHFEIIVVDNNSSDGTREAVESFINKFDCKCAYVFEPEQGLSYARNRGVKESSGEVVAFTDDDVLVDSKWLVEIYEGFRKHRCDILFGKILPKWAVSPPSWISSKLYGSLALLDYGDDEFQAMSKGFQFFGANFAIKKEILQELGNFNTSLGVKGDKHYLGEDTEIFIKALEQDKKIVYNPKCFVWHRIPKERMTRKYFKKWYYDGGWSFALKFSVSERSIINIPFWIIKEFCQLFFKYIYFLLMLKRKESLRCYFLMFYYLGAFSSFLSRGKNA